MNKKTCFLAITLSAAYFLPTVAKADMKSGEFPTMQICLQAIKAATGSEFRIFTDKPDKVSGVLENTLQSFTCLMKSTGSKGTYFEGVFFYEE